MVDGDVSLRFFVEAAILQILCGDRLKFEEKIG
jgi:hypothetical protein